MNDIGKAQQRPGYSFLDAGINNQKIALLHLVSACRGQACELLLPRICAFDQRVETKEGVPFGDVFEIDAIRHFAQKYHLNLVEDPAEYPPADGWDDFYKGAHSLGFIQLGSGNAAETFVRDFFGALIPTVRRSAIWQTVHRNAFDGDFIDAVVQLRIEKDWQDYSGVQARKAPNTNNPDDYNPTFQRILSKVRNSFPDGTRNLYVVSDEKALPVSKDEIRQHVKDAHGLALFWKSDFVGQDQLDTLSVTDLSLLDFEMARESPCFIGLSRSTFSNLVALEEALRHGKNAKRSYIYNVPGDRISRRFDGGRQADPYAVINPLRGGQTLVAKAPVSPEAPLRYTMRAHIATFGDLPVFDLAVGLRGYGKPIEGFGIETTSGPTVEYRARLVDGSWTDWQSEGRFVGTRGQALPLRGFSARLRRGNDDAFTCRLHASFVSHPALVEAAEGEDCALGEQHALEALQIVITPLAASVVVVPAASADASRVDGSDETHPTQRSSEAWNEFMVQERPQQEAPAEQPESVSDAASPTRKSWGIWSLFRP